MGWPDVGCYGHVFHETPNIDRLAARGVKFTDFYAACPVCSPTRASIQSGQYQARFHLTDFIPGHWRPFEKLITPDNAPHLPLEIVTIGEALQQAGYATGYFGKWHLGSQAENPDKQGYQTSLVTGGRHFAPNFRVVSDRAKQSIPKGKYLADFLTDQTLEFIEQHRAEPFFVQLSHYAVHIPLEAKQPTIDKYEAKPKPAEGVNNPVYAAMVEHVDDSVGRVVAKLAELGLTENTLLVFTSDNGGLRQRYTADGPIVSTNAPLRDEKGSLYEGGIRVPLIVEWPGVAKPGGVCDEPTISLDFYATFLEAAAAAKPADQVLDGASLVPLLRDPQASLAREAIYFHYPHYHHSRPAGAIRQGDFKLIEFFDGELELYNLAADIGEEHNLASEQHAKAEAMQRDLAAWRSEVGARMPRENPKYDQDRADQWWSRRTKKPLDR
jgi:uncharacterized sulfatase